MKIDDKPTEPASQQRSMIRGEPGTKVTLPWSTEQPPDGHYTIVRHDRGADDPGSFAQEDNVREFSGSPTGPAASASAWCSSPRHRRRLEERSQLQGEGMRALVLDLRVVPVAVGVRGGSERHVLSVGVEPKDRNGSGKAGTPRRTGTMLEPAGKAIAVLIAEQRARRRIVARACRQRQPVVVGGSCGKERAEDHQLSGGPPRGRSG